MITRVFADAALRMKRAVVETLDGALEASGRVDEIANLAMHRINIHFSKAPACNATLICCNHEAKSCIAQSAQRRRHTIKQYDARRMPRVRVISDECAVTVEENRWFHSGCLNMRALEFARF